MADQLQPGGATQVVTPPQTAAQPAQVAAETPAQEEEFDKARAMRTIQELREKEKEGKATAKRLAELEAKFNAEETAKLTETEKLKVEATKAAQKLAALEAQLKATRAAQAIERAAIKANVDPELASTLVKPDALTFDENGDPTNAAAVMADVVKKWPHIVTAPATPTTPPTVAPLGIPATPQPGTPGVMSDEEKRKRAWRPQSL